MKRINDFVVESDWTLQFTSVRYGTGGFLVLTPASHQAVELDYILTGADLGAIELESFLKTQGKWLPAVFDLTLANGLQRLENKLDTLARYDKNTYRERVQDVFQLIIDNNDGGYGLASVIRERSNEFNLEFVYPDED